MGKTARFLLTFLVIMALAAPAAFAGLSAVGPVNAQFPAGNGFPKWYKDANGVAVDLPTPPLGNLLVPPTMIYGPLTATSNVVARQAGFDTEGFYFNARSPKSWSANKLVKVTVTIGLEASYVNLSPVAGDQMVFSRIRIAVPKAPVAGTYTFSHPWGVETINVPVAGGKIAFTKDFGLSPGWSAGVLVPAPGGFSTVLQAGNTMSTFLRQVSPAPPAGWIGDGVSEATFTGSPIGFNKIRFQGPAGANLDGLGNNFLESTTMTISGHIAPTTATPLPLSVDRVTCSHPALAAEHIDVFLTSQTGAALQIVNAANNAILYVGSITSPDGKFFASLLSNAASIRVTVGGVAGFASTAVVANVVDYINIIKPSYSLGANTLTVQANTSDFAKTTVPPTLTLVGFGTIPVVDAATGLYSLTVPVTTPLPPFVTVTSSTGGSATAPVGIVP